MMFPSFKASGETLARDLGASVFLETSARTGHNVDEMFSLTMEEVARRLRAEREAEHGERRALTSSKVSLSESSNGKKKVEKKKGFECCVVL